MNAAIVTVKSADGRFEKDLELPTNLSVGDLERKLYDILFVLDPHVFGTMKTIALRVNGQTLKEELTLDDQNVFDGSVIIVGRK